MATWQRRTGRITADPRQIRSLGSFLEGANIIARIYEDIFTQDSATITVLVNDADELAVVDPTDRGVVTGGASLERLVRALIRQTGGDVEFEGCESALDPDDNEPVKAESGEVHSESHQAGVEDSATDSPSDEVDGSHRETQPGETTRRRQRSDHSEPFDTDLMVADAYVPDRTVIFTRNSPQRVADWLRTPVHTEEFADGHLIYLDGVVIDPERLPTCDAEPGLSSLDDDPAALAEGEASEPSRHGSPGSSTDAGAPKERTQPPAEPEPIQPLVVAQRGAAYPTLIVVGADRVRYTWDVIAQFIPRDVSEAITAFRQQRLGDGATLQALMEVFPAVEPSQLKGAISGPRSGLRAIIRALGLPHRVSKFLHHERDLEQLSNLRTVEPRGRAYAWRQAVSSQLNEASDTVTEHLNEAAEQVRIAAENVRVHAEAAFDASQTFAEEVILPARRSWVAPTLAVVEATAGMWALKHVITQWRSRHFRPIHLLAASGAVVALADAAVNTLIFATAKRGNPRR